MGDLILLTGGTGLLGSHVLKQGLERGYRFRVLSRGISPRSYLGSFMGSLLTSSSITSANPMQVEHYAHDLTSELDASAEKAVFRDVKIVIHCAAYAGTRASEETQMKNLNVLGTQRLFQAATRAGVQDWIQISSVAARDSLRNTAYADSKREADQWLEEQVGPDVLFLHPAYMFGEWDSRPSSGAVLLGLRLGKIKEYVEATKNFVAAEDVARGLWLAVTAQNKKSTHYALGGHNLLISDFLKTACRLLGMDFEKLSLLESHALSEDNVFINEFCQASAVHSSQAQVDFDYQPKVSLEEMLQQTLHYFERFRLMRSSERQRLTEGLI